MDLDLHLHSTSSDGSVDPRELVATATAAGLDVIALTDHDTVEGVPAAIEASRELPIDVVPAIEISTAWTEGEIHILGYFLDPWNADLLAYTREAREGREIRLREMVSRLGDQGIAVSFDAVRAASAGRGTLGRPHLARAMVEAGHVRTFAEAFDRYIGNALPAYVPTRLFDPRAAIGLIGRAGGVAVWAHPPIHRVESLLPMLRDSGLRGLEAYRPGATPDRLELFGRLAKEHDLLLSGGSDWHGPESGPLGTFRVRASDVADLLAEGGF